MFKILRATLKYVCTAACICMCVFAFSARAVEETIPAEAAVPGTKGTWKTVIAGRDLTEFNLEILGTASNFAGPGQPIIIAKALDPAHITSGPVAGMSGSPVYLGGKLLGAYAYGFTWAKEQALIGITPIAEMLKVLDYPRTPAAEIFDVPAPKPEAFMARGETEVEGAPLQAVPTPLFAAGFSQATLSAFKQQWESLGLNPILAPMGGGSSGAVGNKHAGDTKAFNYNELNAGHAVAGVLMSGDFSMAGTGTVTWRDGERLLAFGHPFLSLGSVVMPMATSEIITIVQSLEISFKLANLGPIVGTLYQDRLPAIAGEIGPVPPMTQLNIRLNNTEDGKPAQVYTGQLFQNAWVSPLLPAMALHQVLSTQLGREQEETFRVSTTVRGPGFQPIVWEEVHGQRESATAAALSLLARLSFLQQNRFAFPQIDSIELDVTQVPQHRAAVIERFYVSNHQPRAGESVTLNLQLRYWKQPTQTITLEVPVPENVQPGQQLWLRLFDAAKHTQRLIGEDDTLSSFNDVINVARQLTGHQTLHIQLQKGADGLRIKGRELRGLPPKAEALFASPKTASREEPLRDTALWKTELTLDAPYYGDGYLQLTIAE